MNGIFVARVIAVHAHDHSLDVELVYDGSRLTGVPLLAPMISTSSGLADMHSPEGNDWGKSGSKTRDMFAVVMNTPGGFIALGFLAHQVSQMMFDRTNFKVDRHASDVYQTIDQSGNVEIAHPSGTFLRIGTSPAHEDLTGKDFDKLWKVTRNTDKQVYLSVTVANTGGVKASFQIAPNGDVSLTHTGSLTIQAGGDVLIQSDSKATAMAASIDLDTSTGMKGVVQGDCICAYTGAPHCHVSGTVKSGK